MAAITNDWLGPLSSEFKKPYYKELYKTVKHEYETKRVFPEPDDIFNAFAFTPLADVKVVILGQDPYHNYGQAQVSGKVGGWTYYLLTGNRSMLPPKPVMKPERIKYETIKNCSDKGQT